jgi:hypothetical protein
VVAADLLAVHFIVREPERREPVVSRRRHERLDVVRLQRLTVEVLPRHRIDDHRAFRAHHGRVELELARRRQRPVRDAPRRDRHGDPVAPGARDGLGVARIDLPVTPQERPVHVQRDHAYRVHRSERPREARRDPGSVEGC